MRIVSDIVVILKILLILCFIVFAASLIFYALLAWGLPKAKNENAIQVALVFIQCFILPILYYIISAIALFTNKNWVWGFVIIGGLVIVLLNVSNVGFRFIHTGLYSFALLTYFLKKLS